MNINTIKSLLLINLVFMSVLQFSCTKFLDAKPDKVIVIPSLLEDLQALLDNGSKMNNGTYPGVLEMPTDDYWLSYTDWSSRSDIEQKTYIWDKEAIPPIALNYWWSTPYTSIFYANVVLDELPGIKNSFGGNPDHIKGSALFFRAFGHFNFAQVFCKPYNFGGDNSSPGIPMRLTSSFTEISKRGTVQQTYDQIIKDLKEAAHILPISQDYKTRPSKPAAFAALARTYLAMEDYYQGGEYADSCLKLYSTLMDYNDVNASATNPFVRFNNETMFFSYGTAPAMLSPSRANVDSVLYESYDTNDRRKVVFFQNNGNNEYGFKGSYIGGTSGAYFNGFATDELYLIRAECSARIGNKEAAMTDLNTLMEKRWVKGKFKPLTAVSSEDALYQIIIERRKELIMRGVRWSDLRRLNKDPRFAKTLIRVLVNGNDTKTYTLPPGDPGYVLKIPADIITLTGIEQNPN